MCLTCQSVVTGITTTAIRATMYKRWNNVGDGNTSHAHVEACSSVGINRDAPFSAASVSYLPSHEQPCPPQKNRCVTIYGLQSNKRYVASEGTLKDFIALSFERIRTRQEKRTFKPLMWCTKLVTPLENQPARDSNLSSTNRLTFAQESV